MGVGRSGRIVIEVEPETKRELYAALARDGLTLKDWFLHTAASYVAGGSQIPLPFEGRTDNPISSKDGQ